MRRPLLLLVLVVALLAVAVGGIAVTSKPGLDDARATVDHRWDALRAPLTARYEHLGALVDALTTVGGPGRGVTQDLREAVARWSALVATGRKARPDAEATSANELESLVARARADVAGSKRLNGNAAIDQALSDVALAIPPAPAVNAYNRAVGNYERERTRFPARMVVEILGHSSRPHLEVS